MSEMGSGIAGAIAVERGCGHRQKGGVYFEVGLSAGGRPLEDFLIDPPMPVPETMEVPTRGVALVKDGRGVWHVVDRVGEAFYPNVADIIEEGRRFGFSRRAPKNIEFEKLTAESRLLLVHARGLVLNPSEYRVQEDAPFACPKHKAEHEDGSRCATEMCAGMWWEDLTDVAEVDEATGIASRTMASFTYTGMVRPPGVQPKYQLAFIASLPLTRIAVVRDDEGGEHERAAELASKGGLPVVVVDR